MERESPSEFEKDSVGTPSSIRLEPVGHVSGGTCRVYTARLSGKKVFVKEIKEEFAADSRMLSAFRKEAEIGFRLDHPHLPKYIYADGVLPSGRYIVQEYIDGSTLPEFIKTNPGYFTRKANVRKFVKEFADVMDYLHSNQILHLDVKPRNVILTRVGNSLKLVDLGFCASDFYDDTRGLTAGYTPPEGEVSPRERTEESDYYGLGKILAFIRSNTPGYPRRTFRRLEKGLLHPDPERRLASRESIERVVGRSGSGRGVRAAVWAGVALLITVILLLVMGKTAFRESSRTPPDIPSETVTPPAEPNYEEVSPSDETPQVRTVKTSDNAGVIEDNGGKSPASEGIGYSPESMEKMKDEMRGDVRSCFAGFDDTLALYIREGKYADADRDEIKRMLTSNYSKAFQTSKYKRAYRDISPSLIDDTMAQILSEEENQGWGKRLKQYMRECQRVSSGLSR